MLKLHEKNGNAPDKKIKTEEKKMGRRKYNTLKNTL